MFSFLEHDKQFGYIWNAAILRRCILKYLGMKYKSVYNLLENVKTKKNCICVISCVRERQT